jgi:hypothetical protein
MHEHERARQERRRSAVSAEPAVASQPGDAVLALQRGAGNRAVTAMLARDKAPEDSGTNTTMLLGDLGVIPLDYANWDANGKEVHIGFVQSPISARFMAAAAAGTVLDPAWISRPGLTSTLTDAVIARAAAPDAQATEPRIEATLNFLKVHHDFSK